ncbi:MAG: aminotransferase class I/II-fold pyridoxal phosphate-dependent enzyme [Clostridia bacterium]
MNKELRLIVTRKCNYDCYFCHGEGVEKGTKEVFDSKDYKYLVDFCKRKYGWNTVTITGGEPLVRDDILEIVNCMKELDLKTTLVSNGELIDRNMACFEGIDRLNVSIHTLNTNLYDQIVQRKNKLSRVIYNLSQLRNLNKDIDIRINMTVVKNQNDTIEEFKNIISLAKKVNASIKIIELFSKNKEEIVPIYEIKKKLIELNFKVLEEYTHKIVLFDGTTKIILSKIFCAAANDRYNPNSYCNSFNDLFVSPDGIIKLCRYIKQEVSIKDEVKNRDDEGLEKKIKLANSLLGKHCPMNTIDKLAINGGNPIISKEEGRFIHPKITKEIEKAVIEQLHDTISIYDNSNIFKKFEESFAKYHNKKYALVTSSGTSALHSLYDAINLREGDEVICPIYTFFATVSPIFQTGAKPVFVDCDETGNIDYKKIEEKINNNTKAIMVTHMWGYPCKMDELRKIADKYGIYLLEDCSHAHGGEYKGKKLGEWSDAAAFSLQGNKIITGGEGGIIITNNKYIYKNCILLGHYNKRCKQEINKKSTDYKYATTGKGLKLRAHPLAIRIAYEQFKNIDNINSIKQDMVNIIKNTIDKIDGLTLNEPYEGSKCSYYALIIKYDPSKFNNLPIERFIDALNAEGGVEYDKPGSTCPLNRLELFKNPSYFFPSYGKIFDENEKFVNADRFYDNSFKIPVWYNKEDENIVIKYCEILNKVSRYYKKEVKNEIL